MAISVFANLKGGVGKTLVTLGCAHAAAAAGKRVLLVDTDPQGNVTAQITDYTADEPPTTTLADVLDRHTAAPIEQAVIPTRRPGIDLLPSGFDELQAVQDALFGKPGAENSLSRVLQPVAGRWDHVFVDTRPATDLITRNALMAADNVVLILEPEVPAIRGADQTMKAIGELEEYLGKYLPVAGWVINRVNFSRRDHEEWIEKICQLAIDDEVAILGDPIPLMADLARLSVVGMGLDEHPRPNARVRNLAVNFGDIVKGIDHAAWTPA
jgi:chromosome partitioning protein